MFGDNITQTSAIRSTKQNSSLINEVIKFHNTDIFFVLSVKRHTIVKTSLLTKSKLFFPI